MKNTAAAKTGERGKRLGIWLLIAVLALTSAFGFSAPKRVYAYSTVLSTYTVKVETGYLALRKGQERKQENEIGELYTGETVIACPVDGEKNGYRYVYSPKLKKLGYVNGDYLVYNGLYDSSNTMYAKVATGYLALRKAKATDPKNEKGKIYTGEPVIVLDYDDNAFWTVYAPTLSKAGYVNRDYLVSSRYDTNYVEPDFPLGFRKGSYASWKWESEDSNVLNVKLEVTNFSRTKTISAFEVIYYSTDVWGTKLLGDTFIAITTEKTVAPGATVESDYMPFAGRKSIGYIYAAVRKVRLSDGTILENRSLTDDSFCEWRVK